MCAAAAAQSAIVAMWPLKQRCRCFAAVAFFASFMITALLLTWRLDEEGSGPVANVASRKKHVEPDWRRLREDPDEPGRN